MSMFSQGQEVKAIVWDDDSILQKGHNGVDKIEVVIEYGDNIWFAIWKDGYVIKKYNGAFVCMCEMKEDN
jgi:hypothetical protein